MLVRTWGENPEILQMGMQAGVTTLEIIKEDPLKKSRAVEMAQWEGTC